MTLEEADTIARIIETADGGCHVCVMRLAELLDKAFPEYRWVADDSRDGFDISPVKAVLTAIP